MRKIDKLYSKVLRLKEYRQRLHSIKERVMKNQAQGAICRCKRQNTCIQHCDHQEDALDESQKIGELVQDVEIGPIVSQIEHTVKHVKKSHLM